MSPTTSSSTSGNSSLGYASIASLPQSCTVESSISLLGCIRCPRLQVLISVLALLCPIIVRPLAPYQPGNVDLRDYQENVYRRPKLGHYRWYIHIHSLSCILFRSAK